jgi:hypothetical protein
MVLRVNPLCVRLARLLTLALVLVAGSFAPGGLFVCMGLDGHVVVESTAGGCVDEHPAGAEADGTRCADDGCGSCLDLGLDRSSPPRMLFGADLELPLHPVLVPPGTETAADPGAGAPPPPGCRLPDRVLPEIRSSILRC